MNYKLNLYPDTVKGFEEVQAARGKTWKLIGNSADIRLDKQAGIYYRDEEYGYCMAEDIEKYKQLHYNVRLAHEYAKVFGIKGPDRFSNAFEIKENEDPYQTKIILWSATAKVAGDQINNFRKNRSIDDTVRANVMQALPYHSAKTGLLLGDRDRNWTNSHVMRTKDNQYVFTDFDFQECCSDLSIPIKRYFKQEVGYMLHRGRMLETVNAVREILQHKKNNISDAYYDQAQRRLVIADEFVKTDTQLFDCPTL